MDNSLTPISDISIIVALENLGPVLKSSTSQDILSSQNDANVVLYFTQRVVFSLGFGNEQVEFGKFHGPMTLMKTKSDKALLLPVKFKDSKSSDSRINRFGRDVIIVMHFNEKDFKSIADLQNDLLARSLSEIEILCPNFEYQYIKEDEKLNNLSKTLKDNLNRFLSLRLWATSQGTSLLHLGTLNKLEGLHRAIGIVLIDSLSGITLENLKKSLKVHNNEEVNESLQDLVDMGFIEVKKKNSENTYIIK